MSNEPGHAIGKMGWGLENESLKDTRRFEGGFRDRFVKENPYTCEIKDAKELKPKVKEAFDKLQADCGRGPNSLDMSLLIYFAFKRRWKWFPQDIGSCVWSNTWRILIPRMIFEIGLRGDIEEYFGRNEHGARSIAPHAVTYGFARQIANMRGGDGLYAGPMAKALSQGMVMCSTPRLQELSKAAGADAPTNFPEPRNPALYRRIGNWEWNDALRPFLANPVTELPPVPDFETHKKLSEAGKPIFQCSMIAIRKAGKHKDGFTIHQRDPNNSWAHNMGWMGHFYASDGSLWFRLANLSWLNDPNPESTDQDHVYSDTLNMWLPKAGTEDDLADPKPTWNDEEESYTYNIAAEHLQDWYRRGYPDSYGIGEIDMPDSVPATV